MDIKKLDEIITLYCDSKVSRFFKDNVEQVYPMALSVLKIPNPEIEKFEWSREISFADSIKYVYMFLNDLDSNLASQFITKINDPDIVKIESRENNSKGEDCVDSDGIVHIYYENTPNDIFIICHEMLHKLNEQPKIETFTRDYFGETVSIMGEMLLGEYLVENGIINQNDFNLRKLKRLNGDREKARDVIIESNLIAIKKADKEINYESLNEVINNCTDDSIKRILIDESNDLKRITSIFRNYDKDSNIVDVLNLRGSQRYVIAEHLAHEFMDKESKYDDFLQLHYAVGDKNCNINDVVDAIREKHPTL